jgi:DNA-binding NtrC family response regulator
LKLLIVEDDERVSAPFARSLRMRGYEVILVANGADGRAALQDQKVDVIIADHGLPGGESGLEFLEWAKREHPEVRRILTSGVGPANGFTDDPPRQVFLAKPYDLKEFLKLIAVMTTTPSLS